MKLSNEIRNLFANLSNGNSIKIDSIGDKHPAWVIRYEDWFGVGFIVDNDLLINEKFSSSKLWTRELIIEGKLENILLLTSNEEEYRYEFSFICSDFIDPGVDGSEREKILENPRNWWSKWKSLLGNSISSKKAYSVIGEMIVYKKLLTDKISANWSALQKSSHDIETLDCDYEVKSTISRYDQKIKINGQFQLEKNKKLKVVFIRFEESDVGLSIESLSKDIIKLGVDSCIIESGLKKLGFEPGRGGRYNTFKVLEARIYNVDKNFPTITKESFINGKLPDNVEKISYTINLLGIPFSDKIVE